MSEITKWVSEVIREEDFSGYDIKVTGGSEKGENYMSEITFVTIYGVKSNGERRRIDLAIKASKDNIELRTKTITEAVFHNEFYAYQKVFPAFKLFQKKKNIKEHFIAFPKCYRCLVEENREIMVMENLRADGYVMHDRFVPMSIEHCQVVLKEYAKLHALSFALRDQDRDIFDSLFQNSNNLVTDFITKTAKMTKLFDDSITVALESIETNGGAAICEAFRKIAPKCATETLVELLENDNGKHVFSHGDSWNNNFLFKYEVSNKGSVFQFMW